MDIDADSWRKRNKEAAERAACKKPLSDPERISRPESSPVLQARGGMLDMKKTQEIQVAKYTRRQSAMGGCTLGRRLMVRSGRPAEHPVEQVLRTAWSHAHWPARAEQRAGPWRLCQQSAALMTYRPPTSPRFASTRGRPDDQFSAEVLLVSGLRETRAVQTGLRDLG